MTIRQTEHMIIYPHELFATLYQDYPDVFLERILGGDKNNVPKFWEAAKNNPVYQAHPVQKRPRHTHMCIPITVHGDGVPVTGVGKSWSRSADIFSWCSCLSEGPTVVVNYLIAWWYTHLCTAEARRIFWKHLCWSLERLYKGVFPDEDPDGNQYREGTECYEKRYQPLAGGMYATLFIIKADLDFIHKELGLPHYGSAQPCALCEANSTTLPWTDCRPGLHAWSGTIYSNPQWKASHPDAHALFSLTGVGTQNFIPDLLHTKHLGTDQWFYGSVLQFMVRHMMTESPEENLDSIWKDVKQVYKDMKIFDQFQSLKLSMFENHRAFPKLKGKGAELRHFGQPLLHAFTKRMTSGNKQHRQIKLALEMSVKIEHIMDAYSSSYALPEPAAVEFREACYGFCGLVTLLGQHFHSSGTLLFNFTIKFHYLLHLGLLAKVINPRLAWCYKGEDFMHVNRRIIGACVRGTPNANVEAKAARKYLEGLHLKLRPEICALR